MVDGKLETNVIYCGDSKDILKSIPDNSVDLIYLDPPFFSHKNYEDIWADKKLKKIIKTEFSDTEWQKLKKSITPDILEMYEHIGERWKGGRKGIYVYIAYMRERLEQCWRVLKPTGSIYLHCDWHAGHYLKVMMDEIFDYNNFRNEIIWSYKRYTAESNGFQRLHDIILFYTKTDIYSFNTPREKYGEKSGVLDSHYKQDEEGKWYRWQKRKNKEPYKIYLSDGRRMGDVWEIPIINSSAKERLGYPTQKPEALLDRIIGASSNEGDIVLDPFCGCGTTLAVSKKLNRGFIGIDISRTAGHIIKERLGGNVKFYGGETIEDLQKMNPHSVAHFIIVDRWGGTINPRKSGDLGIDGWVEERTIPVQVKRWENKVGRPEIDKFKTAIERDNKEKGIIVARDFSKDSYEEVARIKNKHKIDIDLVKFEHILNSHNRSHNHNHGKEYIDHPLFMIF